MGTAPSFETWIVWVFSGALAVAYALTFVVRALANRIGAVARRNARRRHEKDTPFLGGSVFYVVLVALVIGLYGFDVPMANGAPMSATALGCLLAALTLVFGVGVIDDFVELKAPPKLLAEIAAAVLVLTTQPIPATVFESRWLPPWVGYLVLGIWLVGVANAIKMIDGLDGLASGVVAICSLTLTAIMLSAGYKGGFPILVAVALAGCCVGFLFHNFNPAKIFLGDSGSLLMGFALALITIQVEVKRSLFVSLSLPTLVLALPLLDIASSIVRRTRLERSWFRGERSHIRHRLQQIGLGHRTAVVFLWVCTACMSATAYFIAKVSPDQSLYIDLTVVPTLGLWVLSLYFLEQRLATQAAQFSQLFLKREEIVSGDRGKLLDYLREQVLRHERAGSPFTAVVLDCSHFMKEMTTERPYRVVAFYMNLYGTIKGRLRSSDYLSRISEHVFVVLLAGAGGADGSDSSVIDTLGTRVKQLQEEYAIFQASSKVPEGMRVYRFPKDANRIWQALSVRAEEIWEGASERKRAA